MLVVVPALCAKRPHARFRASGLNVKAVLVLALERVNAATKLSEVVGVLSIALRACVVVVNASVPSLCAEEWRNGARGSELRCPS